MMNTVKSAAVAVLGLFAFCLTANAAPFVALGSAAASEKTAVTIAPAGVRYVYDGTVKTPRDVEVTEGALSEGDYVDLEKISWVGSLIDAGTLENTRIETGTIRILHWDSASGESKDVTAYYDITYGTSKDPLVVDKQYLVVFTPSYTNEYNGAAQAYGTAVARKIGTSTVWNFPANDGAIVTNFTSVTKVGTVKNKATFTFVDPTKANNYTIDYIDRNYGDLVITPYMTAFTNYYVSGDVKYQGRTNDLGVVENCRLINDGAGELQGGDKVEYTCLWVRGKDAACYDMTTKANLSCRIVNAANEDVTSCYGAFAWDVAADVSVDINVTKRYVTMTSASDTKMYDGTALSNGTVTVTGDGFIEGEGADYIVKGSQTEVGSKPNSFTYTLKDGTSENNYNIGCNDGTLEVTARKTTGKIKTASIEKVYDGTAVSTNAYESTIAGLLPGDGIVVSNFSSYTDVGTNKNCVAIDITNATGSVSANYDMLAVEEGTIVITKRPLTIKWLDVEQTYNGSKFEREYELIEGDFAYQEFIKEEWNFCPTNAGTYVCTNTSTDVYHWGQGGQPEYKVTGNYDITLVNTNVNVVIKKYPTKVLTASAEKFWDGTKLEKKESGYEIVRGERLAFTDWASQTDVGRTNNTCIAIDYPAYNGLTNNYDITYVYGKLTVKARRVAYDFGYGDASEEIDYWNKGEFQVADAPTRKGYKFVGWTNEVSGVIYYPDQMITTSDEIYLLKAVWEKDTAQKEPSIPATSQYDDKIISCDIDEATLGQRDATIKGYAAEDGIKVVLTIKAPKSTTAELAPKIKFNIDGYAAGQGEGELSEVKFHQATAKETEDYYYVEWTAIIDAGQLNEALKNKVGEAFATTKLYCDWNNDGAFDNAYTVRVDADTCSIKGKFPVVANIVWEKGYEGSKSEVNAGDWKKATKITTFTNTLDYTLADNLVRTGYTFKGWAQGPFGTEKDIVTNLRGLVARTKDNLLENNEVILTALWETNYYNTVFGQVSTKPVDQYEIDMSWYGYPTNNWTVEDLWIPLPFDKAFISKYYDVCSWTNAQGGAYAEITADMLGTDGGKTFTFYPDRLEKVWEIKYDMTNDFANIDKDGTPYQSVNGNITQYSISSNGTLNAASCFGCKFTGWTDEQGKEITSFDTLGATNRTIHANWEEYQAMVVENDKGVTNYFTSVVEAIAAVTNSNTTIAFLDAKGDGINGACPIVIGDNLKDIKINFCALSYTNTTGLAALTIGTNATVSVVNEAGYIGVAPAESRLVQVGGKAVLVGENSTFTLDDEAIVLDVVVEEGVIAAYAEATELYENGNWRIGTKSNPSEFLGHEGKGAGIVNFAKALYSENATNNVAWADQCSTTPSCVGVTFHKEGSSWNTLKSYSDATNYIAKTATDYKNAKAAYENALSPAIYAPSSATLVLKSGCIGAKVYGETNNCASIEWVGHSEYLDSANLFFATVPLQEQEEDGQSQVAAGYIWTTNGVEDAEFPYTVTKLGKYVRTLDEQGVLYGFKANGQGYRYTGISLSRISGRAKTDFERYASDKFAFVGLNGFEFGTKYRVSYEEACSTEMMGKIAGDRASMLSYAQTKEIGDGLLDYYWPVAPGGQSQPLEWEDKRYRDTYLKGDLLLAGTDMDEPLTNAWVWAYVPTGVSATNAGVVRAASIGSISLQREDGSAQWKVSLDNVSASAIVRSLVESLEYSLNMASWYGYSFDWDGAASEPACEYGLNLLPKDIRIIDATGDVRFPFQATIMYDDNGHKLSGSPTTYNIFDTTTNGTAGVVLQPAVGSTNVTDETGTYRFDGWYDGETLVQNLVHKKGAGQDVKDMTLKAQWTKLVWATNGVETAEFATVQDAINALPAAGGIVKYLGTENIGVEEPLSIEGKGKNVTVDFGNKGVTNETEDIDFLVEVRDSTATITNVMFVSYSEKVGGLRVSGDKSEVSLNKTVAFWTYGTMLQAEGGAYVDANGAKFSKSNLAAAVKAFGEDTELDFNAVSYMNTVIVSNNATFRLADTKIKSDTVSVGDVYTNVTAITAMDGAKVVIGNGTSIENRGDAPTILAQNAYVEINDGAVLQNQNGNVIVAEPFEGAYDKAGLVLNGGTATAINAGAAILHCAGTLKAPIGSTFTATTRQSTIQIDNRYGILKPADIMLWGGKFKTITGEALVSRNSGEGDRLEGFMTCAYEEGVKGALFSTGVRSAFCADGYIPCEDDESVPGGEGEFWHFIKTVAYEITYDLDGGTRTKGEEVWPTSYDVEDDVILLPSNTVTKANWYFAGWSNTVTGVRMDKIVPGEDFGDMPLKALWTDKQLTVKVTYTGADGYPKYYKVPDESTTGWHWYPSKGEATYTVTPSKNITLAAPAKYSGFQFLYFEDVKTGKKYEAGAECTVLDFEFNDAICNLRGVWASDMGIIDDQGNKYVTLQDALTNDATQAGTTLTIIGAGMIYSNDSVKAIVIDKDITLDLGGKTLALPAEFADEALVLVTNCNAQVINGTIEGAAGGDTLVDPIRFIANDAKVAVLDASMDLLFTIPVDAAYVKDGYICDRVDGTALYAIFAKTHTLAFASAATGAADRADLVVVTNNVDVTFTCDDTEVIALADATREGYTFLGWYDGNKKVTGFFNPNGVTRDVTLTAKWAAIEYVIAFELDDGVLPFGATTTYTCETYAFELATPVRENYTFKGWRLDGAEPANPCTVDPRAKKDFTTVFTAVAVWAADCYTITFDTVGGTAISPLKYTEEMQRLGYVSIPAAEKAGAKFTKWIDAQGNEVAVGKVTSCYSADLTAVWAKSLWTGDNTVVVGNPKDGRGTAFNGNVTYTGYLMKDNLVAGKVAVTAGKPNTKGLATVTMTVSQELGTGKTYTLKNTAVEVTGEVLKDVALAGGTTKAPLSATITISDNGLTGTFGDYAITASADRFASNVTKIPAATLAYLQGNWTLAFGCGKDATCGATTLKLTVAAKGKVTVAGNLGDGTAVSTTAQLVYGDGVCVCPVVVNAYTGKTGGFSFLVWFGTNGSGDNLADDVEVTNIAPLTDAYGDEHEFLAAVATRVAEIKAEGEYTFAVNLAKFELPEGYTLVDYANTVAVEITAAGKAVVGAANTAKIDAKTGDVTFTKKSDNDLGLTLSYTKTTGALTGSFKVYAKTQNASTKKWSLKTYTAKVYAVTGTNAGEAGAAGSASEKTIGATLVTLTPDATLVTMNSAE